MGFTTTATVDTLLAYTGAVVVLVAIILVASRALGERHREPTTRQPYESGMPVTGSAQGTRAVAYFAIAMLFLVFDLETAYLTIWAVVAPDLDAGAYVAIAVFAGVLLLVWAYVVRTGAFDWTRAPGRGGER